MIRSEADITRLIEGNQLMMDVLRAAERLNLRDWWIGAGFLRNPIWNALEGKPIEAARDIDLVYFNQQDVTPETDWAYDEHMNADYPFADWEIRNQARMHYVNGFEPYTSTEDGIAHWVETATCVGVRLQDGQLHYLFCYGTDDLFGLVARPTPQFRTPELLPVFWKRIADKRWRERWPHLRVEES